jgi:acetoin:2,6-dichlorophenolindophenol oxidoreductase subunit alpha
MKNKGTDIELYRMLQLIRKSEEKLYYLFSTREMPGTMHQYIGQEAVATGVCAALRDSDYITSTHRGHGHLIAKGANLNAFMAEMFAKSTGSCKGMGGSMHIADASVGILGANGIVAGGIPIAVGAGLTCKIRGEQNVAVSFFGDGASNEGAFHESLNMASVWNLPVVFICENNQYGFSTHYRRVTNIENIADRAAGYGMEGIVADGMDVLDVYKKANAAIKKIRKGGGPVLIECKTYRYMGHARFEKPVYRTREEVEEWKKLDCIKRLKDHMLTKKKYTQEQIAKVEQEVVDKIEAAVIFAENSPDPEPDSYKDYIFKGGVL